MKRNLLFWITGLIFLAGCSDDNDSVTPNAQVAKAFSEKYPAASQVSWEPKNSYMTVKFLYDQLSNTAWFNQNGQWHLTETELRSKDQLPEAVLSAFTSSVYAQWTIDEIDRLERPDSENIYVLEVKNGQQEYELYYSEDGVLIKELPDDDHDDYEDYLPDTQPIPSVITAFISTRYPQARIIEYETEHGMTEVTIIDENRSKEVVFNANNEWVNTHYDVRETEIEDIVRQALANSAYNTYRIDDIEKYETAVSHYYLFELEQGEHETDISIDREGQITIR